MTPTKEDGSPRYRRIWGATYTEKDTAPMNDSPIYCRLTALHGMDPLAEAELVAEVEALLAEVAA